MFIHGTQVFYSRTKGGVDCSYQFGEGLNAPTSKGRWEEKLVTQLFKTLAIDGFIAWRLVACEEFTETHELFVSLNKIRNETVFPKSFSFLATYLTLKTICSYKRTIWKQAHEIIYTKKNIMSRIM